jgi:hypothetical protein
MKRAKAADLASALDWLPASPALVAVIGAALPWFAPGGYGTGGRAHLAEAYCWAAGRVGFLAPLALVLVGVAIVGRRHGWFGKNQQPRSYQYDGVLLIVAGLFAGAMLLAAWTLLPRSYTISGLTWQNLVDRGVHLSRNPQPAYFLTIAAAADAVLCGIVYYLYGRREAAATDAGKIESHDGADSGR